MAQVMERFASSYLETHYVSDAQRRVTRDIQACRTVALGGHWQACTACGDTKVHYNSCGNRACPNCQGVKKERWILERKHDMLPVKYFHVVFTLPSELRSICWQNPKLCFNLLFSCAWQTLEAFSNDPAQQLEARMGMISVLHTWTQKLLYHPHIHCIVPSGGMGADGKWKDTKSEGKFLFHAKAMAKTFRGKYMEKIVKAYKADELKLEGKLRPLQEPDAFWEWKKKLYDKNWVVYAKKPFENVETVLEYLARYTHKIAISNYRILSMTDKTVTFSYLNRKAQTKETLTLSGEKFIQRFLMHVLPKGFSKIRHYGILSTRVKTKLINALKDYFGMVIKSREKRNAREVILLTTGVDVHLCSACKEGLLVMVKEIPRLRGSPKLPVAC